MARSPLTLAASVTAALPRVTAVGVAPLSDGGAGRFDSAVVSLDDGRRVVVRAPRDDEAAAELHAEANALRALTPGVRAVLPFAAPEVLGEASLGGPRALVETYLRGYRVDAAHIPPGQGVATSIAASLARVHDLPHSVVRDAGLPVRTAEQVRDEAERLLDRAEATGRLPFGLLRRWSTALADEELWRFETTVVLGGAEPSSFLLEDVEGVPAVTGLLGWRGLSVGDPAVDLRWVASASAARHDIFDTYADQSHRTADALLAERARLHAEFEFASWLVHGHTVGSESIVADAVALLESLDENVRDEPAFVREHVSADDAFAASDRVSRNQSGPIDTSMQTDAFDADSLEAFGDDEPSSTVDQPTQPLEMSEWAARELAGRTPADPDIRHEPATASTAVDPDEAARNALRRWTGTA